MDHRSLSRVLLSAAAFSAVLVPAPAAAQRIDEIIAFGDSYADDGNAFQLGLVPPAAAQIYPTGRFTGGTNYVDTLSQIFDAPVANFAIGGAQANPDFLFEVNSFLAGGGGPAFPVVSGSFDEGDLVTVSIGGNDARAYGSSSGASVTGAPAAALPAIAATEAGLDALVAAGAPAISFLAGDTGRLPEVATMPTVAAIRSAYSTAFNEGMQDVLAGYAADGVMVHYLDLTLMLDQVIADPAAYGLTGITCPAFPDPTCVISGGQGFLFYGDLLHPTSQGSAIIARYVATQLQAPLTLQATSDLGLDTARQFGRTLSSRLDLSAPRDGDLAEGLKLFVVGDSFSRDVEADSATNSFDVDGVGVTAGIAYGFGNGTIGAAGNYSRPRARFVGDIARTETDSWQIGGFAGYALGPIFAQAYAGYGWDDHEIRRAGVVESMSADADGHHWLAGAKAGYLMPLGIFRAGPVVAIDYAKAKVDAYTESGDPALTLNVSSISAKSLIGGIGAELRGDFEGGGVQVRPFVSAMLEADLTGDDRSVQFSQTSAPGIVNSWHFEDRSKDPYGRFSVGGSAAILSGVTLNAFGSATIGQDQGDEISAQVGLRLGL